MKIPATIDTRSEVAVYLQQYALHEHGYNPGPLDGKQGPRTQKAFDRCVLDATRYAGKNRFPVRMHMSPNYRGSIRPEGVVFHHSGGSFEGALSWCLKRESRVSYHVMVEEDGTRHHLVPLVCRAWHAGVSYFRGRHGCNDFMIGFAFSGNTNLRELTADEIESACEFVRNNKDKYGWTLATMTDHRTVSPGRKDDLSPAQWGRLYNALKKEVFNG